jgi:hypothetical protein
MLRDCIAPPGASISYVLINRADRGFEWRSIIPMSQFFPASQRIYHKSSPCRDFHHWLYDSSRGYEDAKYNLNKEGMFLLYDKSSNHVRIVIKDLDYPDDRVPPNHRRVGVPAQFRNLSSKPNYAPAIAGGVLSAAAVAGGVTYGIWRQKQGSNTVPYKPPVNPNVLNEPIVPNGNPGGNIDDEEKNVYGFVEPLELKPKYMYVTASLPGTFYKLNQRQKIIIRQAYASGGKTLASNPAIIDHVGVNVKLYAGSLKDAIHVVWPEADPDKYIETLDPNQPWVFYYQTQPQEDKPWLPNNGKIWRYLRSDPEKRLMTWSEGVYVDPEFPLKPEVDDKFIQAYNRCKSTIVDFQGVEKLRNIFQSIKDYEDTDMQEPDKPSLKLVSMMERSFIMMTGNLMHVLRVTLEKVANSNHSVAKVYKSFEGNSALAERLLTKRVAWYYDPSDIWGCYEDGKLISGLGFQSYIDFVNGRWDLYLHPDESVISSLLGLKVPSFAYDDGQRANACNSEPRDSDLDKKEVIMLPQVGVRLEQHERLEFGDLFLIKKTTLQTPFQEALYQGLQELYPGVDLYEARSRLVIQQAINTAVNHTEETHLILTGLGQGVWRGDYEVRTRSLFSNALAHVVANTPDFGNLKYLTVMAYQASEESIKAMQNACQGKLSFMYEKENKTPVFTRELSQGGEIVNLVDMFSFAWDGMSLVGNEYYDGSCGGSADPAAAYSTSVAFVSHPRINPDMYKRFGP